MAEISIKVNIPEEFKKEFESNLEVSKQFKEFVKRELLKQFLVKKINSPEEQELTKWSVELSRKAKKGRFKRLLSGLSSKERETLLTSIPPEKRAKYE